MLAMKMNQTLRNAGRCLDTALTDASQDEEAWFYTQFEKANRAYYKQAGAYLDRIRKGQVASQFPKGFSVHPLSMLLIRAGEAVGLSELNMPFLYWRSYGQMLFWTTAVYDVAGLTGFREKIFARLRNSNAFAGAMFEALIAFCFKRSSLVDVAFGDDPPDLLIFDKSSGNEYAFECKDLAGLTENQRRINKLGDVFSDQVLSFLRKTSLSVIVWWVFDSIPRKTDEAEKAIDSAIELCKRKQVDGALQSLETTLEHHLGRIIVTDLPEELILSELESGDPRPPLRWRPSGVPKSGELYLNRLTRPENGRIVVAARIAVQLAQRPAYQKGLERNLDDARHQLRKVNSAKLKKVAVIGVKTEGFERLDEAKATFVKYLEKHDELSGIYVVTSPTSHYASPVVDCVDFTRIGLNSPLVHLIGITRPGCEKDIPAQQLQVWLQNERQVVCAFPDY